MVRGAALSNDLGEIGHLKPIIDRLASLDAEFLPRVSIIIDKIVLLTENVQQGEKSRQKSPPAPKRKGRR